eukprot:2233826-Pyramimonas_sp.AAC.1
MGWNWAFYLARSVASWRAQVALGMGPSVALADPGPIPDISEGMPTVLAYCGNIGVASTSCKSADSPRAKIEAQLVADGFE